MSFRTKNFRIIPGYTDLPQPGSSAYFYTGAATSASMGASSAVPGSSTPAGSSAFIVIQSSAVNIEQYRGFSVQYVFTGRQPQGVIELRESNDGVNFHMASSAYLNRDASAATSSTIPPTPTTGIGTFQSDNNFYKFMQVQFIASTASSGALIATLQAKDTN